MDSKCPKCGAGEEHQEGADTVYICGSVMHGYGSEGGAQSKDCRISQLEAENKELIKKLEMIDGELDDADDAIADLRYQLTALQGVVREIKKAHDHETLAGNVNPKNDEYWQTHEQLELLISTVDLPAPSAPSDTKKQGGE